MSMSDIASALRTQLDVANLIDAYPISDENKELNTENVDTYLADFLIPVETSSMGKAVSDSRQESGIYQVSIFTKDDSGRGLALSIVDNLKKMFQYHDEYVFGATTVTVSKVSSNQGRVSNGRYVVDVSIDWFSYVQR